MIVEVETELSVRCCVCREHKFRIDHLPFDCPVFWTCKFCCSQVAINRLKDKVEMQPTGKRMSPITVTLRTKTDPPIEFKLHTWKYECSQDESPEEFIEHQIYLYETHTCPTNWTSSIVKIIFKEDEDPHGFAEFVSVEDGHIAEDKDIFA